MAEIPGIPSRKPPRPKRRVTTSKHWIEYGPLVPWMLAYARWLAGIPTAVLVRENPPPGYRRGPPSASERTSKASLFAKQKISGRAVRTLEARPDFIAYFEKLREDAAYLAKEMLRDKVAKNLDARDAGLDMAVKAKDHKAIESYSRPFVELGFPKKAQDGEKAPRITIHLGSGAAKRLLDKVLDEPEEIEDVEYEVIETKQLTEGEEE